MAEVVGFVLGVVPLVISAIENYENILSPIITYRRFSKALSTFTTELEVQRAIFENECVWILSPFIQQHEIDDMMKDPSHSLRQTLKTDKALDQNVCMRFGASHKQLFSILQLIRASLDEIYEETKDLPNGLYRPTDPADLKAWHQHVSQKMKLAFRKESLNDKINDLRHRNQAFLALSEQINRYNAYSWTPVQTTWDEKHTDKTLEKIQKIRDASQTLYNGFENLWSCPIHHDHSANIQLCLSTTEHLTDTGSKISFDIILTNWDVGSATPNSDNPTMLKIEAVTEEPVELLGRRPVVQFGLPPGPLSHQGPPNTTGIKRQTSIPVKPQISAPVKKEVKKESKRSRFRRALDVLKGKEEDQQSSNNQSISVSTTHSAAIPMPAPPTPSKSESLLLDLGSVPDLCSRLENPPDPDVKSERPCIGYFKGNKRTKYKVYSSPSSTDDFWGAVTLSHIICDRQRGRKLSNPSKWKLAGSLSMATLLYHSTPWLHAAWRSDDVLFFNFEGEDSSNMLESPHLHPGTRKRYGKQSSSRQTWTKNELIYRLGIMLLELEFEDTVANLVEKSMTEGTPPIDFFRADSMFLLKRRAGEHLGTLYGRIVRMCLDCDFGLGLDDYPLEKSDVQKIFYSRVVQQFQERMPEYSRIWED